MPEPQAAEVLQDVAEKQVNAEESTTAAAHEAGEVDPQVNANETDVETRKKKGGWLKKLDRAEQERDFWREEALRNRPKEAAQVKTETVEADKPPVKPVRPKASDFTGTDAYEKYEAARDKYEDELVEYTDKLTDYKLAQAEKGKQQKSEEQEIANSWAEKVAAAEKKYEDFKDVAFNEDIPMSNAVMHAIITSENGTEVAYWLGQNPDEAERISKLNPVAAIREIGKIESRIAKETEAAEKEEKEEAPAATSKAPKPPQTIRRAVSTNIDAEPGPDRPYKEWEAWRNRQLKKG